MEDLKNIEEVERVEEEVSAEKVESDLQMLLKMKEIYNNILQEYFRTPACIRLIYIENRFKPMTKGVTSIEELKDLMSKELEMMKAKPNLTPIEKIEYRLAKKIYRDVVDGFGKEYDIRKPLTYAYDDQVKEFEDIQMGFEGYLKKQEEEK